MTRRLPPFGVTGYHPYLSDIRQSAGDTVAAARVRRQALELIGELDLLNADLLRLRALQPLNGLTPAL
ncbi:hypothetical protein [Nonomuraea basaltis]|uniref:hypothetical protein n=1 Tax=Nonomuraea basaltis TaxID=2495887 RepID=UPI00110C4243|nr:hypothetical protein [Nonomuraea basaltis]TMR96572.1 hypothetical protein EJK15_22695 [Nonomuraea basaltis]